MKSKAELCFVDTSAFVALNHPQDSNHYRAYEIAGILNAARLVLTDLVIAESHALLRYRLGFHVADRFLEYVLNDDQFLIADVNPSVRAEAYRLLRRFSDHKISYCDAVSVAVMKEMQIGEVFAFDRHFEIMGVASIERRLRP